MFPSIPPKQLTGLGAISISHYLMGPHCPIVCNMLFPTWLKKREPCLCTFRLNLVVRVETLKNVVNFKKLTYPSLLGNFTHYTSRGQKLSSV